MLKEDSLQVLGFGAMATTLRAEAFLADHLATNWPALTKQVNSPYSSVGKYNGASSADIAPSGEKRCQLTDLIFKKQDR